MPNVPARLLAPVPPQGKGRPRPDVALAFPELGFHLLFDGAQQRLRLVEVHNATRLQVRGAGSWSLGCVPPWAALTCRQWRMVLR